LIQLQLRNNNIISLNTAELFVKVPESVNDFTVNLYKLWVSSFERIHIILISFCVYGCKIPHNTNTSMKKSAKRAKNIGKGNLCANNKSWCR
jgi:hypothetical protein